MAKLKATTYQGLVSEVFKGYDVPNFERKKIGHNTTAEYIPNGMFGRDIVIRLHGHQIVRLGRNAVHFTLAGYNTVTTRERVNQFIPGRVYTKNFVPHLDGEEIDSELWYLLD